MQRLHKTNAWMPQQLYSIQGLAKERDRNQRAVYRNQKEKEKKMIKVTFSTGANPCVHIENSHLVKGGSEIKEALRYIHLMDGYKELQASGYTRTAGSEYREWKAHNLHYRLGIARSRTKDCDINQNEPKWRRVIYAILSIF